ncbi:efflux pump antibiotic resistance protein [Penicillium riverlandense]|uniref:efflux pump antibiotic resistance protein n=1 Tax=Penicillium riverlandense TaxID=1903569 RepID=UPI00254998B4|nr:efflux pump antibiotic resistance protein [Penicillium riverlandense]KAJ5833437.1 efflux pump antibiotic resistance protein [Penicillium riverlandense]
MAPSAAISTTSTILDESDEQKVPEIAKGQIEMSEEKEDPASPADTGSDGVTLLMTVVALALSMFLVSLDMTIVATAVPSITSDFGGIELVGWYGSAFFITLGGFQATWGKTYKYFPLKLSFLFSIILFELGSLVCGVAPSSLALIVGRAITGIGGAGISSGAFTIIALSAPPKQRPVYIGILGASYGVAAAIGPLIGGAFTSNVTWRWCFYINLPIGGVAGVIILFFYRPPSPSHFLQEPLREKLLQLDLPGTALLIGAMICYVFALQWGGITRPWSDSAVVGTLVGFGVLLVTYAVVQWVQKERAAMVGRLFKRNVVISMIYIDLLAGTFFLLVYYLPIYFQVVSGVSAAESGIRNLPLILAQSVATVASGLALSKVAYPQPFLLAGAALTAIGSGLLYTLNINSGASKWIGYQILAGIGIGWCFQVPVVTAQSAVPPEDLPSTTAMVLTVQTMGGSVFVSAGQSVLDNVLLKMLRKSPGIVATKVVMTGATDLRKTFDLTQIPAILGAYMKGIQAAFLIAIVASSLATVVSLGSRWRKLASASATAAA